MSMVDRVQMPGSSKSLTLTSVDHFMRSLQLSCRRCIARMRVADDHRILRRPRLHGDRDGQRTGRITVPGIGLTASRRRGYDRLLSMG